MRVIVEGIRRAYKKMKEHQIGDFAAQSAFFTVLSIIPFAIIFISLIQYINIDKSTLIFYAKEIIPESFLVFTLNLIEEIYSKTFTTISISILFTLWSASKGFTALMRGFHKIYEIEPKNKVYYRFRSFIFTLFMIVVLVLTFVLLVWGSHIQVFLDSFFWGSKFQKAIEFIMKIRRYGLSIIIFLFFMLIYKFGPQCRLKLKNQILRSKLFNSILVCTFIWSVCIFKIFYRILDDVWKFNHSFLIYDLDLLFDLCNINRRGNKFLF